MIPFDYITAWRAEAPWVENFQVEQDLVISRALVEIFSHPKLKDALAFRGGTALYKLYMRPPARYSEDIDLVPKPDLNRGSHVNHMSGGNSDSSNATDGIFEITPEGSLIWVPGGPQSQGYVVQSAKPLSTDL